MDVGVYYHILEIGFILEKGKKKGYLWKIGERERLKKECGLWQNILRFIKLDMNGNDSSDLLFKELSVIANEYDLDNYFRIINMKEELKKYNNPISCEKSDIDFVNNILLGLLHDLNLEISKWNGKNNAYRLLAVMHNFPRVFHGRDIIGGGDAISLEDAIKYSSWSMTDDMKDKYIWFEEQSL